VTWSLDSLLDLSAQEVRGLAWSVDAGLPPDRPLEGRVVAVLPFGRGAVPAAAWISVAQRLGAGVLRGTDLEDVRRPFTEDPFAACRAAAAWADVLVTAHPDRGFARAAAADCGVPVVSAGGSDGGDPATGLSVVAEALRVHGVEAASAQGLHVAVCGNLRGSPGARALLDGLASLEATVLLVPARGRDLPEDALLRLARRMGRRPLRFEARTMRSLLDMVDTVLLAPETAPQLPLFQEVGVPPGEAERRARREVEDTDLLFVATGDGQPDRVVATPFRGRSRSVPEGRVQRVDPAALGALLRHAVTQGVRPAGAGLGEGGRGASAAYDSPLGLRCRAGDCVGAREPDVAAPAFLLLSRDPAWLECRYCGTRTHAELVGSREAGRYHPAGSGDAGKILDQNLVLFRDAVEAEEAGFERSLREAGEPRPADVPTSPTH
jgi:hypothetical protein